MDANQDAAATGRSGASDILDGLRAELDAPVDDDLQRQLALGSAVDNLDESRLDAAQAAIWRARPETRRERMRAVLARQGGFKLGLIIGFFAGFALTGLFGAMLALHYLIASQ